MDLTTQVEIVLRDSRFETWRSPDSKDPVLIHFENQAVLGFVLVFATARALIERWQASQASCLQRFASSIRPSGNKAWNVYSVFLTQERTDVQTSFLIERIEEDFTLTRKIARSNLATP